MKSVPVAADLVRLPLDFSFQRQLMCQSMEFVPSSRVFDALVRRCAMNFSDSFSSCLPPDGFFIVCPLPGRCDHCELPPLVDLFEVSVEICDPS